MWLWDWAPGAQSQSLLSLQISICHALLFALAGFLVSAWFKLILGFVKPLILEPVHYAMYACISLIITGVKLVISHNCHKKE